MRKLILKKVISYDKMHIIKTTSLRICMVIIYILRRSTKTVDHVEVKKKKMITYLSIRYGPRNRRRSRRKHDVVELVEK